MRNFHHLSLAALLVAACGVPQEEHDKALADQAAALNGKMKEAMDKHKSEIDSKMAHIASLEQEVKSLGGNLSEVAARAEKLGATLIAKSTELASTQKELSATANELSEVRKQREMLAAEAAQQKAIAEKLKGMIDAGQLEVVKRKGRLTLKLPDNILFPSGAAQLKKDGRKALESVAAVLKDVPDRNFLIAGHTDNIPVRRGGRFKSNWDLSTARAVEVVKLMKKFGVDETNLAAAGFAEFDPVGDNAEKDGRAKNRRLEIILLPKITDIPEST